MSLRSKIQVNTLYTRSINLERDSSSAAVVEGYIPTTRALQVMRRVAETLGEKPAPRAWSLVGPYGSGKSSFGVFLPHVLGGSDDVALAARNKLGRYDKKLVELISQNVGNGPGYLPVLLTGAPEPLSNRLVISLAAAAQAFWGKRRGRPPAVLSELQKSCGKEVTTTELLRLVSELQSALAKANCPGIVLVIDELGKFLEYEARHFGANDIYLLQALAEKAYQGHSTNLLLFVLMHQAFEQYAKGLGQGLRDEWAKIQGRFESIPFLEASEQTLRIVGSAISSDLTSQEQSKLHRETSKITKALKEQNAFSSGFAAEGADAIFEACYPLHPVTALLLPLLCQKIAQNERTLFSYLGSHEPHGFQESIQRLKSAGEWIYPWEIFDYFILNQPATVSDAVTHRRWAEVLTALDRLEDASEVEVQLIKLIGLLNIVGQRSGLRASVDLLKQASPPNPKLKQDLLSLQKKSIIQFRKFSGEFRVWQGSDFDIDEAVAEELAALGRFDLVSVLNRRRPLAPFVARRATIESHSLRYFDPVFVDEESFSKLSRQVLNPRLIIFLGQRREDRTLFEQHVVGKCSSMDVIGFFPSGLQLREATAEAFAIERIQSKRAELNSDPIASRECVDRLHAAKEAESAILDSILDEPGQSTWYWKGTPIKVSDRREFQYGLSEIMLQLYDRSPIIRNELINRDNPSSTANAARNKLLRALITRPSEEDLAIEKFPAEKALYRAILREPGFHRQIEGAWALTSPPGEDDPNRIIPLWNCIEEFFESSEAIAKPFTELNDQLVRPPFGVKRGLLPIFYAIAYLIYQDELALYEDDLYVPSFTEEILDRFLVRPETFKVQQFRIEGVRASIFKEYANALFDDPAKAKTLLSVARPLAIFINGLDEFARTTRSLSPTAQKVRDAIANSKSPQKLVFEDLPIACGYEVHKDDLFADEGLAGFAPKLIQSLRELKHAHSKLVDDQLSLIKRALSIEHDISLAELRRIANGRYRGIDKYSLDKDGLSAFILRLTNTEGEDHLWLDKLLMFLGGRLPSKKWNDQVRAKAEIRLSEFARRLRDLEKLRVHHEDQIRSGDNDLEVFFIRSVHKGTFDEEDVAHLSRSTLRSLRSTVDEFKSKLDELEGKNEKLAVIASLFKAISSEHADLAPANSGEHSEIIMEEADE